MTLSFTMKAKPTCVIIIHYKAKYSVDRMMMGALGECTLLCFTLRPIYKTRLIKILCKQNS